ncbi:MAG: ABC transporter ATP-binding protein [Lentisphaeria bacterium]|jgi:ABC-2 type transport system ATP-binding protein|nr:ABC transporter ATP-binding protein [Lentisphaeria bacterium]
MNPEPALLCEELCKRYGRHEVLRGVDLRVEPGQVFGLLGPNGAGKTTLIRLVLGLALPTSGRVRIFGRDLFTERREVIRQVGAVVEAPCFFPYLTAFENLHHLVSLTRALPRERILDTLDAVGLAPVAERKVGTFSYGMKQRLGIAQALLPDTRLLILDEPTNGLDPHGIAGMRNLIRRISQERGIAVLVSSHLLGEIEQVCDRVVILHHGRKVVDNSLEELQNRDAEIEVLVEPDPAALARAGLDGALRSSDGIEDGLQLLRLSLPETEVPAAVRALVAAGLALHRVERRTRNLEEIFLQHTERGESDVRIDSF